MLFLGAAVLAVLVVVLPALLVFVALEATFLALGLVFTGAPAAFTLAAGDAHGVVVKNERVWAYANVGGALATWSRTKRAEIFGSRRKLSKESILGTEYASAKEMRDKGKEKQNNGRWFVLQVAYLAVIGCAVSRISSHSISSLGSNIDAWQQKVSRCRI